VGLLNKGNTDAAVRVLTRTAGPPRGRGSVLSDCLGSDVGSVVDSDVGSDVGSDALTAMIAWGMNGFLARVIRTKWPATSCVQLHAVAHIWPFGRALSKRRPLAVVRQIGCESDVCAE
jgi:hypothetical protein